MKKWMLTMAAAVAAMSLGVHAGARERVVDRTAVRGDLADVTVTDRSTGASLPIYQHLGEYWVAGAQGAKYAVDIRNTTAGRVLAVTSVDGVNVFSGETASVQQSGYVLSAYQRYGITGWRKSNSDVAAFEFTAAPDSYAQRTGRPRDVGVIGVALFREKAPVPAVSTSVPWSPYSQRSDAPRERAAADKERAAPADAARASSVPPAGALESIAQNKAPDRLQNESHLDSLAEHETQSKRATPVVTQPTPKLGTGHGERESSYVSPTSFERETSRPAQVVRIRYDSYANLVASGVIAAPRPVQLQPNPFPDGAVGYVPDPPRWK